MCPIYSEKMIIFRISKNFISKELLKISKKEIIELEEKMIEDNPKPTNINLDTNSYEE